MKMRVFSTFVLFTVVSFSSQAQATLDASRLVDLKKLIGTVQYGCLGGPAYRAFTQSLIHEFPINVDRPIVIVAPPGIAEVLGKATVTNKGEYTEFVVPVLRGHLSGLKVTSLLVAVGNENGIRVDGIEFDAPKAKIESAFKSELAEAKRWAKKRRAMNDNPPTFSVEVQNGRALLVCDSSD